MSRSELRCGQHHQIATTVLGSLRQELVSPHHEASWLVFALLNGLGSWMMFRSRQRDGKIGNCILRGLLARLLAHKKGRTTTATTMYGKEHIQRCINACGFVSRRVLSPPPKHGPIFLIIKSWQLAIGEV
jgi:hypothetical protein